MLKSFCISLLIVAILLPLGFGFMFVIHLLEQFIGAGWAIAALSIACFVSIWIQTHQRCKNYEGMMVLLGKIKNQVELLKK